MMPEFEEDKSSEDSPGGSSPSVTFRQGSSPNDLVEGETVKAMAAAVGAGKNALCTVTTAVLRSLLKHRLPLK